MNDNETRRHQMFIRVRDFGTAHTDDFAAASLGKTLFNNLNTIITELDGHAAAQSSSAGSQHQGTTTRGQARAQLRDAMEAIARTARAMSSDLPGIADKFLVPHNNNDSELLTTARAFAGDAAPHSAQFIAHELPADFLAELNTDISALEAAMSDQSGGNVGHVSARAAIDETINRGNETVHKLDAIVRNKYANNSAVLAAWTSASHTERAPRRHTGPVATTPPPNPVPPQH
ncbi:MAG: hypothetical protein QOE77_2738 [Blastocatellia bacterium]|jgi:hypothetical protein|nr:hypothetical protein [Blastocatellia bacterium]